MHKAIWVFVSLSVLLTSGLVYSQQRREMTKTQRLIPADMPKGARDFLMQNPNGVVLTEEQVKEIVKINNSGNNAICFRTCCNPCYEDGCTPNCYCCDLTEEK